MSDIVEFYKVHDLKTQRVMRLNCKKMGTKGFDFFSITLEGDKSIGDTYDIEITKDQFQTTCETQHWVTDIHSFDYENKTAILKIGKMVPVTEKESKAEYSWRKWSLENNMELELLMVCKNVFDRPNL